MDFKSKFAFFYAYLRISNLISMFKIYLSQHFVKKNAKKVKYEIHANFLSM